MKIAAIFLLILFALIHKTFAINIISQCNGKEIEKAFLAVNSMHNLQNETNYFNKFPENYQCFIKVFGFNDYKKEYGEMYNNSDKYIEMFFQLKNIDKKKICSKLIKIGVNAKWQVDGVNVFQHWSIEFIKNNTRLFSEILSEYSQESINLYLSFLLSGLGDKKVIIYKIENESKNFKIRKACSEILHKHNH